MRHHRLALFMTAVVGVLSWVGALPAHSAVPASISLPTSANLLPVGAVPRVVVAATCDPQGDAGSPYLQVIIGQSKNGRTFTATGSTAATCDSQPHRYVTPIAAPESPPMHRGDAVIEAQIVVQGRGRFILVDRIGTISLEPVPAPSNANGSPVAHRVARGAGLALTISGGCHGGVVYQRISETTVQSGTFPGAAGPCSRRTLLVFGARAWSFGGATVQLIDGTHTTLSTVQVK